MKPTSRAVVALTISVAIGLLSVPAAATPDDTIRAQAQIEFTRSMKVIDGAIAYASALSVARGETIVCPVPGSTFTSSFGAPRDGHTHQGNDMMAAEGAPIYAPEAGLYRQHGAESFYLDGDSGTQWFGTHLSGHARGDGLVQAGDLIAYVGHTGNASASAPHLHMEQHPDGGAAVDPYAILSGACLGATPVSVESGPGVPSAAPTGGGGGCYATFTSPAWLACWYQAQGRPVPAPAVLRQQWRQLLRFLRGAGSSGGGPGSLVWHWQNVANCESGDNVNAVSSSGTYRGWLQFSQATWSSYGGPGDPLGQPREVAAAVAERYRQAAGGTSGWPHCGAYYR